jgi:hypothetical protein
MDPAMVLSVENQAVHLSPMVLAILLLILAASVGVFVTLVRRETKHRRTVALAQWAHSRELRVLKGEIDLPELAVLAQFKPRTLAALGGENLTLARIETAETLLTAGSVAARRWNLAFRKLAAAWRTTALRPTEHSISLADLFSLSSYPSLMPSNRFMIFGAESRAAQTLAASSVAALLPADLGLVLYGNQLIVDFSGRVFDEIEFDRLIDLIEQLVPLLTPPGA